MAKKAFSAMELTLVYWVISSLFGWSLCMTVSPAPQDDPTSASPSTGEPEESTRAIDQSMSPIYIMTNYFLETILNPNSITVLANKTDLGDFTEITKSLQENWQMWASHYYCYVICVVFAVIYSLGLPISGLVMCCCRRRGKCGGNSSPFDRQFTKHKRRGCAIILGLFLALLLVGTTASFVANMLIYEQTSNRLPNTIASSLKSVEAHHSLTLQQLDDTFSKAFQSDTRKLSNQVRTFPELVKSDVGQSTGCGPLLESAQTFIDGGNETMDALNDIDSITSNLSSVTVGLETELTTLRTKMIADFSACSTANDYCQKMVDIANKPLTTVASYLLIGEMDSLISDIENVYAMGIMHQLSMVYSEYDQISDAVETQTANATQELVDNTQTMTNAVLGFKDSAANQLRQFSVSQLVKQTNKTITPWIIKVGDYRYYGGIAFSSLALLFATLVSVGLLFGACGERASEDANTCNRGQGACLLMTASGFIFGLAWVLMLGACALLIIGGVAHNGICRHMVDMKDGDALNVISKMLVDNFNISLYSEGDSLFALHARCKDNPGIYTAAEIDTISPDLNITRALDQVQYGIGSHIASLRDSNYVIGGINLAQPDFLNSLATLDTAISSADLSFARHRQEMNKNITTVDFKEISALVKEAGANESNPDKGTFEFYKAKLQTIEQDFIAPIVQHKASLVALMALVEGIGNSFNEAEFSTKLTISQGKVTAQTLKQDSLTVVDEIDRGYSSLAANYDDRVRTQIGKCGSVHTVVEELISSSCIHFLYPFNAYWFSLGWCLFFYIPTIALAIALVSVYRKTDKFELLREESSIAFHNAEHYQTSSIDDAGQSSSVDTYNNTRPLPDTPRQSYYGPARGLPRSRPVDEYLAEPAYHDVMYDGASRGYTLDRQGGNRDTYYPPERRDRGQDNGAFQRN